MDYNIQMPLYGRIPHQPKSLAWDLYQTRAMSRLRDISLSSVPAAFAPHGMTASRFQHSVAVGYLARIVAGHLQLSNEEGNILLAAALLHDTGSPPFSHVAEIFQAHITGRHHEAEVERIIAEDDTVRFALDRHGVDSQAVIDTVTGVRPITGQLMAGSIDIDNIDNSLHVLHSITSVNPLPYQPEQLVKVFCLNDGQLCLNTDGLQDMLAWAQTRRRLYDVLYAPETMSATASLYRAIELAFANDDLTDDFFAGGEGAALEHLRTCNSGSAWILEALSTWHHYPEVARLENDLDFDALRKLSGDWKAQKETTDRIAEELELRPEQVALYVGIDKGVKRITLPWVGDHSAEATGLFDGAPGQARVTLYCQTDGRRDIARRVLDQALQDAMPTSDGHSFF